MQSVVEKHFRTFSSTKSNLSKELVFVHGIFLLSVLVESGDVVNGGVACGIDDGCIDGGGFDVVVTEQF